MVANKDVVGGRLLAKLAQHAHHLAAMERGVIDDMEQELPAGDCPVDRVEFQRKFGFREGFHMVVQAFPQLAPALLQTVQVRLRRRVGKASRVSEFGEREQLTLAKLAEPEALRIVVMAQRSRDANVG